MSKSEACNFINKVTEHLRCLLLFNAFFWNLQCWIWFIPVYWVKISFCNLQHKYHHAKEFIKRLDASGRIIMLKYYLTNVIWSTGKTMVNSLQSKWKYRSSRSQMFFKIAVLKNFAIFTRKHLRWSLFLIKLQTWMPVTLLKRESNTGVFLWIFRNF